ncbi:MAG: tyrosine-type recombinase/integrase [Pyrinomonadaceae bacterium]
MDQASAFGATDSEPYVFPWHGREQKLDPTNPMTSWRFAWRSMLNAAELQGLRFHDGRHTVITTLAEKGVADWVFQAQVGHVDPQMMKMYSHVRRKVLDEAAAALEPTRYDPKLAVEIA